MRFLLKYMKTGSIFDFQDQQKEKVVSQYHSLVRSYLLSPIETTHNQSLRCTTEIQQVKPLLTWRLQNLNLGQNFYKDSDPFFHDGIYWKLFVSKLNDKEC